jgi:HAD superfamily hydrolase (TIGR01509 family)
MTSPPRALLFDLDGTIVDTDALHFDAFRVLFRRLGRDLDEAGYRASVHGKANELTLSEHFPTLGRDERVALAAEKERYFRASVHGLAPRPGLLELLRWAGDRAVPTALVTNAPRENAMMVLGSLGLLERFEAVVLAEELARTKPDPLPYRHALALLGVTAAHAIAFEDSLSGIQSASGAGIETVGLRTQLPEAALRQAGAGWVIADFRDPALGERLGRS